MEEHKQAVFNDWAIVDVLGHQRYAGHVTTEAFGGAVLFRIEVPPLEERERVTTRAGYHGAVHYPKGATVKEMAVQGYTKLIGAGSIYAITPCTQEACMAAVEEIQPRPLQLVSLPPEKALAAGEPVIAESIDDSDLCLDCGHSEDDCRCGVPY